MNLFCKHSWYLLSETTTKSKFEHARQITNNKGNLPWQLCDAGRKHIQVFKCVKCGQLKRFVERI